VTRRPPGTGAGATIDVEIRWALARPTLDVTDDKVGYPGLEIHQLVEISAEK
jgi:hypothetical protein